MSPRRGEVYDLSLHGAHYFVVVSNDSRNARMPTFVGVRVTTSSRKAALPTVVQLSTVDGGTAHGIDGEPMTGWVLCDTVLQLPPEGAGFTPHLRGHLSASTMQRVDAALRTALAL